MVLDWGGNGKRHSLAEDYEIRVCRIEKKERGKGPGDCEGVEAKAYVAPGRDCVTSHDLKTQVDPRVKKVYAPKFCLTRSTDKTLCVLSIKYGSPKCFRYKK